MKKVSIVSLIALLAIVISSCGSSNSVVSNHGISKRKYNKGFFFQRKSNLKTADNKTKAADLKEDKSIAKAEKVEARKAKKANTVKTSTSTSTSTSAETFDVAANITTREVNEVVATNISIQEVVPETEQFLNEGLDGINWEVEERGPSATGESIEPMAYENRNQPEKKAKHNASSSRGDAMFVLAVIFAILLPPLGVGIYTNIDWTKVLIAFLLTLLLFLPGMIYALLVVFDVI